MGEECEVNFTCCTKPMVKIVENLSQKREDGKYWVTIYQCLDCKMLRVQGVRKDGMGGYTDAVRKIYYKE